MGEETMWGLHAIGVGVLVGGLLATIGASGCCTCCQSMWKSDKPPAEAPGEGKEQVKKIRGWDTPWFDDKPGHLTADRIHGGIY